VQWEEPSFRRYCERLGTFSRLILFDKRGVGPSARVQIGTLEERMEAVRAVMDEIGSERAALIGKFEVEYLRMLPERWSRPISPSALIPSRGGDPQSQTGQVLVSSTVKDLVAGSGIALVDRGLFALKGVEGERRLYSG
jgi:hypothetical protein